MIRVLPRLFLATFVIGFSCVFAQVEEPKKDAKPVDEPNPFDGMKIEAPENGVINIFGEEIMVQEILDDLQLIENPPAVAVAPKKSDEPEPPKLSEDIENLISKHLEKMETGERRRRTNFMDIVIEDVARLCELDAKQRQHIELASKGATERAMTAWRDGADRAVKRKLQDATIETAPLLLANLNQINVGSIEGAEAETLWKDALADSLTKDQINAYKELLDTRERLHTEAFAMVAIATLDETLRLTPEQRKKLEPIAKDTTREFLKDIRQYWGDYYERAMLLSLIGGAEPEKVKEILSEKQFVRWKQATSNFEHFWKQRREMRKQKEKKDAKMKEAVK